MSVRAIYSARQPAMDSFSEGNTFSNDHRGNVIIGVVCLVCPLATLAVGLRFYTRYCLLKRLGLDDYLALIALVSIFQVTSKVLGKLTLLEGFGMAHGDLSVHK